MIKRVEKRPSSFSLSELSKSLATLNIDNVRTPYIEPTKGRLPPLPQPLREIIEPPQVKGNISYEDCLPTKIVEEPSSGGVQDKQAARLIVIRKKKMKKHKLRKLRKKMKFEWAKRRQKREMQKEKLFQAELIQHIKIAESFDPAKYAAEKIAKSKKVELPQVWHGVWYPDFIIKQLVEEEEIKKKEKAADEKRKANMSQYVRDYIKNLPK